MLERLQAIVGWIDGQRDHWIEAIRMYLGLALFLKGASFVADVDVIIADLEVHHFPYTSMLVAHMVGFAHIGGGMLLALGLFTRIAAAVQVPVLLGAIFIVHFQEGLFTTAGHLELDIIVLFLLAVFAVRGSCTFGLDAAIRSQADEEELHEEAELFADQSVDMPPEIPFAAPPVPALPSVGSDAEVGG